MKKAPKRSTVDLPSVAAASLLMYFVPALAAVGAIIYVVRIALSTVPVTSEESAPDP